MSSDRKMAMVANQVKADDEDALDIAFWLAKTPSERLAEVFRLRKNYYTLANGDFPEKIEKVVHFKKM